MPSTWGLNGMSGSWNEAVKKLSDLDDVLRKFNDQVVCPRKDRIRPFQDLEFRALHIDFDESDPGDFRADTIERVGADERGNRPIRPHGGCGPVNALRPSDADLSRFLPRRGVHHGHVSRPIPLGLLLEALCRFRRWLDSDDPSSGAYNGAGQHRIVSYVRAHVAPHV